MQDDELTTFQKMVENMTESADLVTRAYRWLVRRGHHDQPVQAYLYHIVLEREGLPDWYYRGSASGRKSRRGSSRGGGGESWISTVRGALMFDSFHRAKKAASYIIYDRMEDNKKMPQMVPWRVVIRCYRITPHMDIPVSGPNATIDHEVAGKAELIHVLTERPR